MKRLILIPILALLVSCGTVQPGADPFIVRIEQTQSTASASFDMVLRLDNANRSFWQTNAPGFHNFCEWLRTPMDYAAGKVPRCIAIQLNVDDLKGAYKFSKTAGNSNALFTAWAMLNAAMIQTTSWSNIITSPIKP